MTKLAQMIRTAGAIGTRNIARALVYRAGLRSGLHPVVRLKGAPISAGPFFYPPSGPAAPAERVGWQAEGMAFGWFSYPIDDAPPDWFTDPMTSRCFPHPDRPWHAIRDFSEGIDVKAVWELSLFDWVVAFAQHARQSDNSAIARLNQWLADWAEQNPGYYGPNWKCGQEASIRVMHLAAAALLLGQINACTAALADLIHLHLRRIAPTIGYALSQDNNHGTSEAAALLIGGSWLARQGHVDGDRWAADGRRWLEERARRLIGDQGSFSQYSVNYHRMLLDTLSFVEIWRRHLGLRPFTPFFIDRARLATLWMHALVDPSNGDAPNAGANDGAHILNLTDEPYRDYRISIQRAGALFLNAQMYKPPAVKNADLSWLEIALPDAVHPLPVSSVADDNGFASLHAGHAMAMLRYPRFRFRPSQADALHLDLWVAGVNLLRDGGTYSYNAGERWLNYFTGVQGHNTVMFDDRNQMPRLGRFLFADWLKTDKACLIGTSGEAQSFEAAYTDRAGSRHRRCVTLSPDRLVVADTISGFNRSAVLRWRLAPGDWTLNGQTLTCGEYRMDIRSSAPVKRCEIVEGFESRHYLELASVPVLEIEVWEASELQTEFRWS